VPSPSLGAQVFHRIGSSLEPLDGLPQARAHRCLWLKPASRLAGDPQECGFHPVVFVGHTGGVPPFWGLQTAKFSGA
jgi:hypothetical protein